MWSVYHSIQLRNARTNNEGNNNAFNIAAAASYLAMHLKLFNAEAETVFFQQSYALPGEEEYQQQSPMTRGSLIMLPGMMETTSFST